MWCNRFGRNRGFVYGRAMRAGGTDGRVAGGWPGNGPFSHLPPWERPGWIYGRGACWRFLYGYPSVISPVPNVGSTVQNGDPDDERNALHKELEHLEARLKEIRRMMEERVDG